jgi:hypothetical protein
MDLPELSLAWPLHYVGDWNGDGDRDMMISVFGLLRFIERSFIDQGYITAQTVGSQTAFGFPCHTPWADADGDTDVDQVDFAAVQACLTGRNDPGGIFDFNRCHCFDRDLNNEGLLTGDSDVEADELMMFLNCMGGPGMPPAPTCGSP